MTDTRDPAVVSESGGVMNETHLGRLRATKHGRLCLQECDELRAENTDLGLQRTMLQASVKQLNKDVDLALSCNKELRAELDLLKHDGLGQARMSFATRTENAKLRKVLRMLAKDLAGLGLDNVCKYIEAALAEGGER